MCVCVCSSETPLRGRAGEADAVSGAWGKESKGANQRERLVVEERRAEKGGEEERLLTEVGGTPPPHPPPPLLTSGYSCRRMGISGRNGLEGLEWREEGGMLGGERKHEMGWIATPTVHRKVG